MKDDLLAKGTMLFQCSGRCGWDVFVDSIDPRLPDGPIFCSECDKQRAGYDKHDFTVTFADGRTYSGRFDAKPDSDFHLGRRIAQCRAYYVRQGVAEAIAIIDECDLA